MAVFEMEIEMKKSLVILLLSVASVASFAAAKNDCPPTATLPIYIPVDGKPVQLPVLCPGCAVTPPIYVPDNGLRPTHPIYIDGKPTQPIYIPKPPGYPTNPIVIDGKPVQPIYRPPGVVSLPIYIDGKPTNPIYLPELPPGYPTNPIVIDGKPTHPIFIPPVDPGSPTHPIYLPPVAALPGDVMKVDLPVGRKLIVTGVPAAAPKK
jgi:hypothetical protein